MTDLTGLKNECLAIGSLPYTNVNDAMTIVKKYYNYIPFCPQLPRLDKNEDMIKQYLGNMPAVVEQEDKLYLDSDTESFSDNLEQLFITYEESIEDITSESLNEYGITEEYSKVFNNYLDLLEETNPQYAKTQITGPFTLSTSLTDKNGKCAYYDETLREVIVKTLVLKALWQIKEIKRVSPNTTPIVFIDEPTLSQIGTSAYITIPTSEIVDIIREISEIIQQNGGVSAIHCCGKCDWSIPIKTGINIINFDAFSYSENMSLFVEDLKVFLENGGYIAWGVVPTLDKEALIATNIDEISQRLENAKKLLINKGLDKELLENHLMISPSCGCGSLTIELAEKAITLTKELSDKLKG